MEGKEEREQGLPADGRLEVEVTMMQGGGRGAMTMTALHGASCVRSHACIKRPIQA